MLTTRQKLNVIKPVQLHDKDTGSASSQIAILSRRIDELTGHLKTHAKDNHSRRGLINMVSQRRSLLNYLSINSPKNYTLVLKKLGLKK